MKIGSYQLKLEKRTTLTPWQAVVNAILAIVVALFLFGFIFIFAGISPLTAYKEIFSYAFFNEFGLPLTINRFIFLLLCTYAFVIPYRAGLWNIGMTGQLYAGALAAFGVLYVFGVNEFNATYPPAIILLPLVVLGAALGGAAIGAIAGYMKGKYDINEIVVTMMLNFMMYWFVSFMIKDGGIFMNAGGRGESFELPTALRAPIIFDVPITIFLALGAGVFLYYLFEKTRLGYEIKAYGQNPAAAAYAGISRLRIPVLVFVMGGALAGLAGYHYFGAVPGVYKIARNYGLFGDLGFLWHYLWFDFTRESIGRDSGGFDIWRIVCRRPFCARQVGHEFWCGFCVVRCLDDYVGCIPIFLPVSDCMGEDKRGEARCGSFGLEVLMRLLFS